MKRNIYIVVLVFLIFFFYLIFEYKKYYDNKLHIVFCNVGQGDGIFIRTPRNNLITVDGGPDSSIVNCISRHTPFWIKDIDVAVLTHKNSDHYLGIIDLYNSFNVKSYATTSLKNQSEYYDDLIQKVDEERSEKINLTKGYKITTKDGVVITVIAPSEAVLKSLNKKQNLTAEEENTSVVLLVRYGKAEFLLTGDSTHEQLDKYLSILPDIDVLQAPHHGSKTGLDKKILDRIRPEYAVISVGNNSYGHPSSETISLLKNYNLRIYRTDQSGDIEFVTDGKYLEVN